MAAKENRSQRAVHLKSTVTVGYYTVSDVQAILGCCDTLARKKIRELNDELEAKGFQRYPRGKVPKKYFDERFNHV